MTRRRLVAVVVVLGIGFTAWAAYRVAHLSESTQATNPVFRWEFVFSRPQTRHEIWLRGRQHLRLTLLAMGWGLAISVVLALVGRRFRWLLAPIYGLAGALFTIPSIGLFSVLSIYNSNETAAVIALTSYTLLILTRAFVDGLDGVPPSALDAADGLGMSRWQRLRKVELPLATPVILDGVRVATVTVVGLVGITAVIQLGGFASWIFDGYRRTYTTTLLLGTVLSILLAVVLDLLLRGVEWMATPWRRRSAR